MGARTTWADLESRSEAAQRPQEPQQTATLKDRIQDRERAAELMESITEQLEKGNAPQLILYSAISAIGLLTNDPEWAAAAHDTLDTVYADLEQDSFLTDNAAVAAHRLEQMQQNYNEKLKRQLERSIRNYDRLVSSMRETLNIVTGLDPDESSPFDGTKAGQK